MALSFCSNCHRQFDCGAKDPAFDCWCVKKPLLLKIKSGQHCFCEACFDALLLKQGELRCFRMWLAYLGTNFCGFQEQENGRTVAGELKRALRAVCGQEITLAAAGRTDASVHARGQVVSVSFYTRLLPRQLLLALHQNLPEDLSVWRIDEMPLGFDARRQSVGKRYVYRIDHGLIPDPFQKRTHYFVRANLDVASMREAAKLFIGEHDFKSFRASACTSSHARRYLWQVSISEMHSVIEIDIRGNAFCMNMVRIIAGTLIEVGKRKRSLESISRAFSDKNRLHAGKTAPAHGLTLEEIYYPDDLSTANIPPDAVFPRFPVTALSWPF